VNCWIELVFIGSAEHSSQISTVLGKCEPSLEGRFLTSQFLVLWCSELCCVRSLQPSAPSRWYVEPWDNFGIPLLWNTSRRNSLDWNWRWSCVSRSFFINRSSKGLLRWMKNEVMRSSCSGNQETKIHTLGEVNCTFGQKRVWNCQSRFNYVVVWSRVFNRLKFSGRHDFQAKKFGRKCTKSRSHAVGLQEKSSKNLMQNKTYYICITNAPPT